MGNLNYTSLIISPFYVYAVLGKESPIYSSLFPGSDLRGSLMIQMKKYFCVKKSIKENCAECPLRFRCNYSRIFETPRPEKAALMKKYPEVPHPFALSVIRNSTEIIIRIVLFGEYIQYFPVFLTALSDIGKKKDYEISKVENMETEILKNGMLSTGYKLILLEEMCPEKIDGIDFMTPLRIRFQEKYVNPSTFTFKKLFVNILRRYKLLSYFYASSEINEEKDLIEQAENISIKSSELEWLELERYSMRKKTDSPIGGIIGRVIFNGDLTQFSKLIKIGHYIQVGKNTSFGCGFYRTF